MKPHLKSIAAVITVFLALGCWNLPVRAQAPSMLYPYYFTETQTNLATFSIVLRLFGTDQEYNLTGAYMASTFEAGVASLAISAKFDASTNTFSGLVHSPPAFENDTVYYNLQGTYDPLRDRFAIQFMRPGDQIPQLIFERIDAYADPNPLMVGIWQWAATDPNYPNLPFEGEFYVYLQNPSGEFHGVFSNASPQDVGLLIGQVAAPSQSFTFRRYTQEGTFEQIWNGNVVTNNTVLQGTITQNAPRPAPPDLSFVAEAY
jgi:hypothetical protein